MDYTTEVVNITKIKDGFFLGDEATAESLDIIIQFKITHMINAAGVQIINAWESIGIKYLTLNWSDNPTQILFDQKDEIANKIVSFIDETFRTGEGILVHSLKAQNRGCIVILIYLIKKHRWTLNKSLEFLNNKKLDVEIPKYFLNQLTMFENRLIKIGQGPKTNTFNELSSEIDNEERLLHNTFLNGLNIKNDRSFIEIERKTAAAINNGMRHIQWADNNNFNRKDLLCNTNITKELFFQKEIKPVLNHKKNRPSKSILKKRSASVDIPKKFVLYNLNNLGNTNNLNNSNINNQNNYIGNFDSNNRTNSNINVNNSAIGDLKRINNENNNASQDSSFINNYLANNTSNIIKQSPSNNIEQKKNINSSNNLNNSNLNMNNSIVNKENLNNSNINSKGNNENNTRLNHFKNTNNIGVVNNPTNNNSNIAQLRSFSLDQKNDKNRSNNNTNNKGELTKVIITPNIHSVYNHNVNNYYIQSANELNFDKIKDGNNNILPPQESGNAINYDMNNQRIGRPNSNGKKDNNNFSGNNNGYNFANNGNLRNNNEVKGNDNQRFIQNNYMGNNNQNFIDNKQMKVIDYKIGIGTNSNNTINQGYGMGQSNSNKNIFNQNGNVTNKILGNNNGNSKQNNYSVNNYQPDLNKKNYHDAQSHGIGLLNHPNSNLRQGPVKLGNSLNNKNINVNSANLNLGIGLGSNNQAYGTIKRSSSNKKNDGIQAVNERPSTAPQKNDKNEDRQLNPQGSMKRLPSPNVKSKNNFGNSAKNVSTGINYAKYRSLSPSIVGKPPMNEMGLNKSEGFKPTWK